MFLLSDFLASGYESALTVAARRHDLVAMQVVDPREREMPPVGLMRLEDAETGRTKLVDTSDAAVRRRYEESTQAREQGLQRLLRRAGCDLVTVDASRSVVEPLQRFFVRRGGKRR